MVKKTHDGYLKSPWKTKWFPRKATAVQGHMLYTNYCHIVENLRKTILMIIRLAFFTGNVELGGRTHYYTCRIWKENVIFVPMLSWRLKWHSGMTHWLVWLPVGSGITDRKYNGTVTQIQASNLETDQDMNMMKGIVYRIKQG